MVFRDLTFGYRVFIFFVRHFPQLTSFLTLMSYYLPADPKNPKLRAQKPSLKTSSSLSALSMQKCNPSCKHSRWNFTRHNSSTRLMLHFKAEEEVHPQAMEEVMLHRRQEMLLHLLRVTLSLRRHQVMVLRRERVRRKIST